MVFTANKVSFGIGGNIIQESIYKVMISNGFLKKAMVFDQVLTNEQMSTISEKLLNEEMIEDDEKGFCSDYIESLDYHKPKQKNHVKNPFEIQEQFSPLLGYGFGGIPDGAN